MLVNDPDKPIFENPIIGADLEERDQWDFLDKELSLMDQYQES